MKFIKLAAFALSWSNFVDSQSPIQVTKVEYYPRVVTKDGNKYRIVASLITFSDNVFIPSALVQMARSMNSGQNGGQNSGSGESTSSRQSMMNWFAKFAPAEVEALTTDFDFVLNEQITVNQGFNNGSGSGGFNNGFGSNNYTSGSGGFNNGFGGSNYTSGSGGFNNGFGGSNYTSGSGGFNNGFGSSNYTSGTGGSYSNVGPSSGGSGSTSGSGISQEQIQQVLQSDPLPVNTIKYEEWFTISSLIYSAKVDPFQLTCNGIPHMTNGARQMNDGPPPTLFFPSSANYMTDFLATMFNVTQLIRKQSPMSKRQMVAIIFDSGESSDGQTMQMSQIGNLTAALDAGQCTVSGSPFFESSSKVFVSGNLDPAKIRRQADPDCDNKKLTNLISVFRDTLAEMDSSTDYYALQQQQSLLEVLLSGEIYSACSRLLDSAIVKGTRETTITTSDCTLKSDDPLYPLDPCCNKVLGNFVCCRAREVTKRVPALTGVNATLLALSCAVGDTGIVELVNTLNTYVRVTETLEDPKIGCKAGTFKTLGTTKVDYHSLWSEYQSFISTCREEVFGTNSGSGNNGKTCTYDSDCYTSCQKSSGETTGKCVIPWGNPSTYLAKCYIAKMNPSLKSSLLRSWGIYNSSDTSQFSAQFLNRTSVYRCQGPNAWRHNGGWYQLNPSASQFVIINGVSQQVSLPSIPKPVGVDEYGQKVYNTTAYLFIGNQYIWCTSWGDSAQLQAAGCFYLPPSRQSCISDQQCNWDTSKNAADCNYDRLANGGSFCGNCYGGNQCWDLSQKGGCILNDYMNEYTNTAVDLNQPKYLALSSNCTVMGGSVYYDRLNPWNQPRCILNNVTTGSACNDACQGPNGPRPSLRRVCVNPTITSDVQCNSIRHNGAQIASMNYRWNQRLQRSSKMCTAWVNDNSTCSQYQSFGFIWDWASKTDDEKLDESFQLCGSSYCFNPNITSKQECDTTYNNARFQYYQQQMNNGLQYNQIPAPTNIPYTQWLENLNGGKGFCGTWMNNHNTPWKKQRDACSAYGQNWKFYVGRRWEEGVGDSEEKCLAGVCNYQPGVDAQTCSNIQFCNRGCSGCVPSWSSRIQSLCYHKNMTICSTDTARSAANSVNIAGLGNVCIYSDADQNACTLVPGAITVSCNNYNSTTCTTNPFQNQLSCMNGYRQCDNRVECEAAGECSDYELENWQNGQKSATCVLPGTIDKYGYNRCDQYYSLTNNIVYGRLGCYARSLNAAQCQQAGGKMFKRASSPAECIALTGCKEPGKDPNSLSPKNETECTACGGTLRPHFSWYGGTWNQAQMVPMSWKTRGIFPVNTWTATVDENIMRQYLDVVINNRLSQIIKTETQCRVSPILNFLKSVACKCGVNVDDQCSALSASGSKNTTLSSSTISCGDEASIYAGSVQVTLGADSVKDCSKPLQLNIGMYVASADSNSKSQITKRSDNYVDVGKRSTTSTTATAECYAVVNSPSDSNVFIGQLRGDCVVFNPSGPVSGVQLCMSVKDSIPYDSVTYPNYGVALATISGSNSDVYTATSLTATASGSQYCVTVSSAGTYCPASFMSNYASVTSRAKPTCNLAASAIQAINQANQALVGSAVKLQFAANLDATVQAATSLTSFTVQFLDNNNALVTTAAAAVTVSILSGSGSTGATIIGTARVVASGGTATFTTVAIDKLGTNYQLIASAGSLATALSSSFSVTAGAAAGLSFSTQPGGAVLNNGLLQTPVVAVIDAYGNVVTSSTVAVTITALQSGSTFSSYTGTSTKNAVSGLATFNDLNFNTTSSGITLVASATGLSSATSTSFNVVDVAGYAVKLGFQAVPSGGIAASLFSTQPAVVALDFNGNLVTGTSGTVTLSILANTGASAATLGGSKTVTLIGGVASFTDIVIDRAGSNYQFVASSSGLASATSTAFTVNGASTLAFKTQPASVSTSGTLSVAVQVNDLAGSVYTASADYITLTIKPLTGTVGAVLSGTSRVQASNGVATFSGLKIQTAGTNYVLVARSDGGLSVNSNAFTVTSGSIVTTIANIIGGLSPVVIGAIIGGIVVFVVVVVVLMKFCRKKSAK